MKFKWVLSVSFMLFQAFAVNAYDNKKEEMKISLTDVSELIGKNRSVIIANYNKKIAEENLSQRKSERLPEVLLDGNGLYGNTTSEKSFLGQFKLYSEWDLYTGGMHKYAIQRIRKDYQVEEERFRAMENSVRLQAYVLLYDIHRNIKYREFVRASIMLRSKEYDRIDQLYQNGVVLKSDLLRSKLYITNLQKDEVSISNSINILSDKLCSLLGMEKSFVISPSLDDDLEYKLAENFGDLFSHALSYSPELKVFQRNHEKEKIVLDEIRSQRRPHIKLYAQYGISTQKPSIDYDYKHGGEFGAKLSFSISSFFKTKHRYKAQESRISKNFMILSDEQENIKNNIYELYVRYTESLLNIERALEKIEMSKESMRILRNSYFNQQALLIDVLESETQTMEASFEWVEAIVNSQKYYWALKQVCGYM